MILLTVLVHYNNPDECVALVQDLINLKACTHYLVVVDNQSSAENYNKLLSKLKTINCEVIQNSINGGYGSGINLGVKVGQKYKPDFIQVMNTDVKLLNTSYPIEIMELMKMDKSIAAVGPAVIYKDGSIQNTILPEVSLKSAIAFKRALKKTAYIQNAPKAIEVDVVNGVCLLINNESFKEINGFDEDFFMYGEEQDLCYRLRQNGKKVLFWPGESIVHFEEHNTSNKCLFGWRDALVRTNQLLFLVKHRSNIAYSLALLYYVTSLTLKKLRGYLFTPFKWSQIIKAYLKPVSFNNSFKS